MFDTIPLHISQWAICIGLGFAIIPIVEIHKIFIRLHMKKNLAKEKEALANGKEIDKVYKEL